MNEEGFVMVYKLKDEVTQLPRSTVVKKHKKTWLELVMDYAFLLKMIKMN